MCYTDILSGPVPAPCSLENRGSDEFTFMLFRSLLAPRSLEKQGFSVQLLGYLTAFTSTHAGEISLFRICAEQRMTTVMHIHQKKLNKFRSCITTKETYIAAYITKAIN